MKKLLAILILFSACQKEEITDPEKTKELQAVTFDVSGFERETEPMTKGAAGTSEEDHLLSEVRYYVYGEDGKLVNAMFKTDLGEYKFHDSLPRGSYKAVFLALSREDPENSFIVAQHMDDYNTAFYGPQERFWGIDEFFFKIIDLEVGSEPIVMNDIQMERGVAAIRVELTDEVFPDGTHYTIQYDSSLGFPLTSSEPDDDLTGPGGWQASWEEGDETPLGGITYTKRNSGKLLTDVIIIARRSSDTLAIKTVPDVLLERGKRTILRGQIFDNDSSSTQEFTIKVDSTWSDGGTIEF